MAKWFKNIKVWYIENALDKQPNSISMAIKILLIVWCIALVFLFGRYITKSAQVAMWLLWKWTVNTVSSSFWKEMQRDEFWNVNIMLVGIWWENHHGWYLSDTTIVASRNPELGAVTMISIPRDLYIVSTWYSGRINGLFARWYNHWDKNIWSWAENLITKVEEIVWLQIPYYAVVDFQWFKDFVDTLWGIDVYVPSSIHDTTYPDENLWYITFHITAGQQTLDWETALMYARSRHTTSDFSRSQRQQDIIKAAIKKATQKWNITSISKLKDLYSTYTKMVTTNITSKEMVGMFKYVYNFNHIFSFGLNNMCNYKSYNMTDPGCFLYNWVREAYGGMAVMVPNGASPSNVSFYDYIQNFSFFVTHNQWYLVENPRILIKNWINKNYAYQNNKTPTWWANKIAVKMKKYWFNIAGIENQEPKNSKTTVIVYNWEYTETIKTLQSFMPISVVTTWEVYSGIDLNYDMELILWDDFIDSIVKVPFNYEK